MKTLSGISTIPMAVFFLFLFNQSMPSYHVGKPDKTDETATGLPQIIKSAELDRDFNFAGERIPIENFDVAERLDREILVNSYWHSSTMLNIKQARRFFPEIEKILREENVPEDFKFISVAESNLRNATSSAGAKGFWQFMTAVARGYGLEINNQVDERYHLEKSTRAACQLIKSYKERFGSWTNAAAAYNIGETRFASEMDKQKMTSFFDMNLGEETNRYLFRVVAFKDILENPDKYGFYPEEETLYKPLTDYKEVTVEKSIPNLGDFAIEQGTTYRMLKIYNPWLISSSLTISSGNSYIIKIPNS